MKKYAFFALLGALAVFAVLPFSPHLKAEDKKSGEREKIDRLLEIAKSYFNRGAYNQAYRQFRQILKKYPKSAPRAEIHYYLARIQLKKNSSYSAWRILRRYISQVKDPKWKAEYQFLLGKVMVDRNSSSRKKVEYLKKSLEYFEKHSASKDKINENLFALARAYAVRWQYKIDYSIWKKREEDFKKEGISRSQWRNNQYLEEDKMRRQKVIALYERLVKENGGDSDLQAKALLHLAAFYINHLDNPSADKTYYPRQKYEFTKDGKNFDQKFRKYVKIGMKTLEKITDEYSNTSRAPLAGYLIPYTWHHRLYDLPRALKEYDAYLRSYGHSRYAGNARRERQKIKMEELKFQRLRILQPGKKHKIQVQVRNIPVVSFAAYKINLDDTFSAPRRKIQDEAISYIKRKNISPHKEWSLKTGLEGKYTGTIKTMEFPFTAPGAYLVRGRGSQITTYQLVVLSDFGLVIAAGKKEMRAFVTDLESREPVPGATVAVKLSDRYRRHRVVRAKTGADGVASLSIEEGWRLRGRRRNYFYHQVVARKGDHHGLTRRSYHYRRTYHRGNYRIYTVTDRPLYKPHKKVNFKVIIRRFQKDTYKNFAGKKVRVLVKDPRGNKVYNKHLVTSQNGSIHDSFQLKKKAPLGLYKIYTYINGRYTHRFNSRYQLGKFRVEEYKEPEYVVNIEAPEGQVFPGDKAQAKVVAKYYYGAPLRLAKVKYEIYRQSYHWPRQVSRPWLNRRRTRSHGKFSRYRRYRRYSRRVKVAAGKGATDEKGEFAIDFQTAGAKKGNQTYEIKVEVIDKSRRSIKASKKINVTKKGFAVTVKPKEYLAQVGKKVELTLEAKTASKKPVKTAGTLDIYLKAKKKEKMTFVKWKSLKVRTDKKGRAQVSYTPKEEGYYKFVFATADHRDHRITGEAFVWIVGPDYDGRQYDFKGLTLIPNQKSYESNEKAQVLINSPYPGATAWIVISGDQRIFDHQVVPLKGESKVFTLPLKYSYVPNVYLSCVVMAKGRKITQTRTNIEVQPYSKKLLVSLTPSKKQYSPGSKATFDIKITDHQGRPVSTDACLSVVDTSLFYIQPELVPSIREYFFDYKRRFRLRFANSHSFSTSHKVKWELGFRPRNWGTRSLPRFLRYQRYYNYRGFHADRGKWIKKKKEKDQKTGGERKNTNKSVKREAEESRSDRRKLSRSPASRDGAALKESSAPGAFSGRKSKKSRSPSAPGKDSDGSSQQSQGGEKKPQFKKARVRKNFSNLAYWSALVKTNKEGKGQVEFTFPDKLTNWKATLRAATPQTQLGQATAEVKTKKLILIRLQSPRFFTERDEVILSGIVHNYSEKERKIKVDLELKGGSLQVIEKDATDLHSMSKIITLSPGKDYRVDWLVKVVKSGEAKIQVRALSEIESDAAEKTFPVFRHGIQKFHGQSLVMLGEGGKQAPAQTATHILTIPKERIPESTEVKVVLNPSLAAVVLEALPYLANYPYGCVEQTMSRFLPSTMVRASLMKSGFSLKDLAPGGGRKVRKGAFGQVKFQKANVLSKKVLDKMIEKGLARLYSFQHSDGGWGWWKRDSTNYYMTAYVLYGLAEASRAGLDIDSMVMERGARCLLQHMVKFNLGRLDPKAPRSLSKYRRQRLAYSAFVLSAYLQMVSGKLKKDEFVALVKELSDHKKALNPYGKALTALALQNLGLKKRAKSMLEALHKEAKVHQKSGTVHWGKSRRWYYWYSDPVEATAFALRATMSIDPQNANIPGMVKWLVMKRKGTRWHSTKATATAILALTRYMKKAGELNPNYKVAVRIGGKLVKTFHMTRKNLFSEHSFVMKGKEVSTGEMKVEIDKMGEGNLYYSVFHQYFSLKEDITPAGHKLEINRTYSLIKKENIKKGEKLVEKISKKELESGAVLKSGDIVEVRLEIKSEEDFEYLIFEDHKPAGMEAIQLRSGPGRRPVTYKEMRKEMVAIFISRLPQGKTVVTYRLRAEIPGKFHGMPTVGYTMYTPHIKANSAEFRTTIRDE